MSVLTDAHQYATSSRVRGVYRYLIKRKNQREKRETLESLLSPQSLTGETTPTRPMVHGTISECIKMQLLYEDLESGELYLNQNLPVEALDPVQGDQILPFTLATLMLTTENNSNENLALVISWFLAQKISDAPKDWTQFEAQLFAQTGAGRLGMNDARFSQFLDWICFLGFAWWHSLQGERVITPDPTAYLRRSVKNIFSAETSDTMPVREFMNRLAEKCPVFENGAFRSRIESESKVEARDLSRLSTTTTFGLLSLRDEGVIELYKLSDADVYILPEGERLQRYSHIKFIKQS